MENTVETMMQQSGLDDAALNPVQETMEEPISDLSEITNPPVTSEASTQQDQPPAKEPGWIKKRVDAAAAKASRETEARLRAEFDAILAPIRESVMDRQADELVRSGEFKSKERALEYLTLKNNAGTPVPQTQTKDPARDEQGRFVSQNQEPAPQSGAVDENRIRANFLAQQAEKIKNTRGLDVAAAFQSDPQIQQRVLSGEWDFYDVADAMSQRRTPSPVRTSNGASVGAMSIASMTDEQFARLNQNLAAGKIYDAR